MQPPEYYLLKEPKSSLLDYLTKALRSPTDNDGDMHKDTCRRIRANPSIVGLDSHLDACFETPTFINQSGQTVIAPDLVFIKSDSCFIVEVGASKRVHRQLRDAFRVLTVNFNIKPELIAARYEGHILRPYAVETSLDDSYFRVREIEKKDPSDYFLWT